MRTLSASLAAMILMTPSITRAGDFEDLLAKAEAGDLIAQVEIADAYAKGLAVAKDPDEARKWLTKAAEQGSVDAQMSLGSIFIAGKGVPRDSREAAKWYQLAANQGGAAAQCQMARMHLAGAGVVKNDVEAYRWASLAAAQGDHAAKKVLGFVKKRMSPEKILEGERLVLAFHKGRNSDGTTESIPRVAPPLE